MTMRRETVDPVMAQQTMENAAIPVMMSRGPIYKHKGWLFKPGMDIPQCYSKKTSHEMAGEGCNVHGVVALS